MLIKFIEKSGFDTEKEKIQNHYNRLKDKKFLLAGALTYCLNPFELQSINTVEDRCLQENSICNRFFKHSKRSMIFSISVLILKT